MIVTRMTNSKQIDHLERRKALAEASAEAKKADIIAQLAYFKYIRDMLENEGTGEGTRKSYDEMMKFFDGRIEELEMDAVGKTRYSYVLEVLTADSTSVKVLKTSQQVYDFIVEYTQQDWVQERYLTDEGEEYHVPDAEEIDEMVSKWVGEIELCSYSDLSFNLTRNILN